MLLGGPPEGPPNPAVTQRTGLSRGRSLSEAVCPVDAGCQDRGQGQAAPAWARAPSSFGGGSSWSRTLWPSTGPRGNAAPPSGPPPEVRGPRGLSPVSSWGTACCPCCEPAVPTRRSALEDSACAPWQAHSPAHPAPSRPLRSRRCTPHGGTSPSRTWVRAGLVADTVCEGGRDEQLPGAAQGRGGDGGWERDRAGKSLSPSCAGSLASACGPGSQCPGQLWAHEGSGPRHRPGGGPDASLAQPPQWRSWPPALSREPGSGAGLTRRECCWAPRPSALPGESDGEWVRRESAPPRAPPTPAHPATSESRLWAGGWPGGTEESLWLCCGTSVAPAGPRWMPVVAAPGGARPLPGAAPGCCSPACGLTKRWPQCAHQHGGARRTQRGSGHSLGSTPAGPRAASGRRGGSLGRWRGFGNCCVLRRSVVPGHCPGCSRARDPCLSVNGDGGFQRDLAGAREG